MKPLKLLRVTASLFCLFVAAIPTLAEGIDLLGRYPTKLSAGDTVPSHARSWEFTPGDIYHISGFKISSGTNLQIEVRAGELGIGHCADGAVWAAIIPDGPGWLTSSATSNAEEIAHVWLRFHPKEINHLFPPETVSSSKAANLAAEMQVIASVKKWSSWQANGNAMIPEPNLLTIDIDAKNGVRRFFIVDRDAGTNEYIAAFEKRALKPPPAVTAETLAAAFDQLWEAFDKDYAMFTLRPEVDWQKLRDHYRPQALRCGSAYEFADVCASMLKELRDLHVWLTLGGADVPVFNRPRIANANPAAYESLLENVHQNGRVQWAVTADKIGFIAIYGWSGPEIATQCDEALEKMRDTRGLIVDVRLNGGGAEPVAAQFAGRFLEREFTYAHSQFRNGPSHTNLTEKFPRTVSPHGPWRYDRPVVLLIGQKCMSSSESFVGMMTGSTNVTTLGDHTCGSSGNPKIIDLPFQMTVSVPQWMDYRPDGMPLDERGFEPKILFESKPGAFEGQRDDLLAAALERLRPLPLPEK